MFTGVLKLTLDMSKLLNVITRDQEQMLYIIRSSTGFLDCGKVCL